MIATLESNLKKMEEEFENTKTEHKIQIEAKESEERNRGPKNVEEVENRIKELSEENNSLKEELYKVKTESSRKEIEL
jgi:hypothetical protein